MDADRDLDVVDRLLKTTSSWEPPDGFALRVIAVSRADVRRDRARAEAPPRLGFLVRLAMYAWALARRRESALWVLRQYRSLLRVR